MEVISPCISKCCLDDEDICIGCFRSMDEILVWGKSTNEERHEIIERTNIRKQQHAVKYPVLR